MTAPAEQTASAMLSQRFAPIPTARVIAASDTSNTCTSKPAPRRRGRKAEPICPAPISAIRWICIPGAICAVLPGAREPRLPLLEEGLEPFLGLWPHQPHE